MHLVMIYGHQPANNWIQYDRDARVCDPFEYDILILVAFWLNPTNNSGKQRIMHKYSNKLTQQDNVEKT